MALLRIALLLSGLPRHFHNGYADLRAHVIANYETDVFLHAWFDPATVGDDYMIAPNHGAQGISPAAVLPNTDRDLIEMYRPTAYGIEPQRDVSELAKRCVETHMPKLDRGVAETGTWQWFFRVVSAYLSLSIADGLRREHEATTGIIYDLVVRARYDNRISAPVDLASCYPAEVSTIKSPHIIPIPDDKFAVAGPEVMTEYCSLYDNLPAACETATHPVIPESILDGHLRNCGVRFVERFSDKQIWIYQVHRGVLK